MPAGFESPRQEYLYPYVTQEGRCTQVQTAMETNVEERTGGQHSKAKESIIFVTKIQND